MTQITIRQTGVLSVAPNAEISFDGEPGFPVTVENPFSAAEEERLAWYFEKWLNFPFTDGVKAAQAAASVRGYGETLFRQLVLDDERAYSRYQQALSQGVATLQFQIVGDPSFHGLHWEALWDPARPQPFVLDAGLIRSGIEVVPQRLTSKESATINLLLVTARPHGGRDVGYRTIQRPLVELLHRTQLPVQVDLVRPGTWRALVDHLRATKERHGAGHYQIIHFDLHGAVLPKAALTAVAELSPHSYKVRLAARYARPNLTDPDPFAQRPTAWLFFEDETGDDLDAASAKEVADLLLDHGIPIAILNACQSGQETGDAETSLGSRLLQAGVQTVVAMSYSVTVSGATALMGALYRHLFQPPHDLLTALAAGRTALHHEKARKAGYNQQIELEDWLLPVLYQPGRQSARHLPLRAMSFDEQIAFFSRQSNRYTPPDPEYGFVGRDLDILQIEKRLLRPATSPANEGKSRNLLLIQGMGGAGKSTLLRYLAGWWQRTALVQEVFYFGYDEKAYTLDQLLDALARQLLNVNILAGAAVSSQFATFQAMPLKLQATLLAQKLRSENHLLILDNLESVTGDPLAIPNTLSVSEKQAIRAFLSELLGGQSLVLLGSRGGADWLQGGVNPPLRAVDSYALPGLDPGAAADLAERILTRQVADESKRRTYAADPAFTRLIKLLDGSPLALEVVLSNLARQTPGEIVAALEAGEVGLDTPPQPSPGWGGSHDGGDETTVPPPTGGRLGGGLADKTRSILQCIAYSHSNLSSDAQQLLLCLAPFSGVLWADQLENYAKHLVTHLPTLPVAQWPAVLRAAQDWGLLTPHEVPGFLRIQPVLPYFLKTRLAQEPDDLRQGIETAFRLHYAQSAKMIFAAFEAKEPQQRQVAKLLTQVEYENLTTALQRALTDRVRFFDLYAVLGLYLDSTQDHQRGIELGQSILAQMEHYTSEMRFGAAASSFLRVQVELGERQANQKQFGEAEANYRQALTFIDQTTTAGAETKGSWKASTYHQLGIVAQAQRQWAQAEQHYQQALALKIEFNDRYSQASTYHQLGRVAQEQRQWAQAEQHYQQALALTIEFNDRYSQGVTYHQLGMVAQEQRQWVQAEQHYQQALAICIEFNDRYSQARTYHQLGRLAEEQEQWAAARDHLLKDLEISAEFDDEHGVGITMRSLARLHRAGGDETLPAAVAAVLGVGVAEVAALFAQALGDEEGT